MKRSIHILYLMYLSALIFTQANAQVTYEYYKNPDKIGSSNPQATEYFIKSFEFIMQWGTEDTDSAIYYMQKAIEEDSLYAIAYASLGHMIKYKAYDGSTVDVDSIGKLAEKALQINPNVGDALTLQSWVYYMDNEYQKAIEVCKKAVEVEPDHRETWLWLGIRYSHVPEKLDSAIMYFMKTIEVDSLFGQPHQKLGWIYLYDLSDYPKAAYHFRQMIYLYENVTPRDERMIGGYEGLALALIKQKKFDDAIDTFNLLLVKCEQSRLHWISNLKSWTYAGLMQAYMGKAQIELYSFLAHNFSNLNNHSEDAGSLENFMREIHYLKSGLEPYSYTDTLNSIQFTYFDEILKNAEENNIILYTVYSKIHMLQDDGEYQDAHTELTGLSERYADNQEIKALLLCLFARNYALQDKADKSVKYLNMAIKEGYSDFGWLKEDRMYEKLKNNAKFKKIESQINQ